MLSLRKPSLILLWIGYILAVAGPVGYHSAVEFKIASQGILAILFAVTTGLSLVFILSNSYSTKFVLVFAGVLLLDFIIVFRFFNNTNTAYSIALLGTLTILRFRWWSIPIPLLYIFSATWLHLYTPDGRRISHINWQEFLALLALLAVSGYAGYLHSRKLKDTAFLRASSSL